MPRQRYEPRMKGSFRLYGVSSYDDAVGRADAVIAELVGGQEDDGETPRRWWLELDDGDPDISEEGVIVGWSFAVRFTYPEHPPY
jgi:hypothetical protein